MQFPQTFNRSQIPLFHEGMLASNLAVLLSDPTEQATANESEAFSELSLQGSAGNCLHLLAPILRELSQEQDSRWLTLISAPSSLTQDWLRQARLNRERILLLQPRSGQDALQLTCEALSLGRSNTVVSWIHPLSNNARQQLCAAAQRGQAQSLNIRLG